MSQALQHTSAEEDNLLLHSHTWSRKSAHPAGLGTLRGARRAWQVNLQLQPLRIAGWAPQEPGPLMGLKQAGMSDTTAPQPIVPHQLQYMSSVWFVNHRIQWLFAWEAADRGLGGLPELNYRTSLKGFSFIFSKESFEQTDMSLLDELKNILLKKIPTTYVFTFVWLKNSFHSA